MALKVRKSNSWVEVGGGTSYTLPTFGTTNGASGLRLTGSDSSTDDVNFIGAGGILSAEDAVQKVKSGADLVQLYTGFIYNGPKLIRSINKALIEYYKST